MNFLIKNQIVLFLFSLCFISSCSNKSEVEDLKSAQMCLNSASNETAQSCVLSLSGDSSPRANQLKCAASFIEQGFGDPVRLINAIESSENSNSVGLISELSFINVNQMSASLLSENALNVCSQSGVKVYSLLSTLAHLSTLASALPSFDPNNPIPEDEYKDALTSLPAEQVGQIILTTYSSSCTPQTTESNDNQSALKDACKELDKALSTDNPLLIGQCLQYQLTGSYDNNGTPMVGNPGNGCPDKN